MRKIAIILILAMCFSTFGSLGDGRLVEAKETTTSKGNIKIIANVVNVREEKSTNSNIICQASKDDVYELLGEGKDSQGKVWYKVGVDFVVTGWVAGWFCKKTNEKITTAIKSKPGELLYNCSNKDLFAGLLLVEDYSLENLLKIYGSEYSVRKYYSYTVYEYKNGVKFEVDANGEIVTVAVGERSFYISRIKKKTCDILNNKGNEILIIYSNVNSSSLIILDATNKKVLREYSTIYTYSLDFEVGNFVGDSNLELYLYETGSGFKKGIYKVIGDDFIKVFDTDSFNYYSDGIKANINKNILNLNIHIGSYSASKKSTIPERVFYNTKETTDKNKLLSVDPEWSIVQESGKWYIKVRCNVNIIMLRYYWGPPDDNMEPNEIMQNDLARVDLLLDISSGAPKIKETSYKMKYNDDSLLSIRPMLYEEGTLVNGPELGMGMEEAYKALGGGEIKEGEYSDHMELNGVSLLEFCSEVVGIYVESPKYTTHRGLKVGDSIQNVESLYGKPDVGFSGDDYVEYKFCYETMDGELKVNYYRTLTVCYKDGLVSAFELYQVILD